MNVRPQHHQGQQATDSWNTLRQFVNRRPEAVERCELCSQELPQEHEHLVDPQNRQLLCSCQACAMLFDYQEATKYRRVPRDVRFLEGFQLSDSQWDALQVPIGLGFFFHSSPAERVVAVYPSPAGPIESQLELEAWDDIVRDNPVLRDMQPDTEALLVNRIREARDYYRVPIDECYKLIGLIRARWEGFSGGTEVWEEIDAFFAQLKRRSRS